MAIKKEALIRALIKFQIVKDEAEAKTLIEDKDEKDLVIPEELSIFSKNDLTTRDQNQYNTGKLAGEEMLVKNLFEQHKITTTGKKDVTAFLSEYSKNVLSGANITVDEKIKEKNKEIEILQANLIKQESLAKELEVKAKLASEENKLRQYLHPNRDDRFKDSQYLTLLKGKYQLTEIDGKEAVKDIETGEIVRDPKLASPLKPEDVFKSHFENNKWTKGETQTVITPGRGGKDNKFSGSSRPSNMKEFIEYAKERGLENINGEKGKALLREVVKDNPSFSYSEKPSSEKV